MTDELKKKRARIDAIKKDLEEATDSKDGPHGFEFQTLEAGLIDGIACVFIQAGASYDEFRDWVPAHVFRGRDTSFLDRIIEQIRAQEGLVPSFLEELGQSFVSP